MIKEFVPYEQALALKELGFDEPCLMYFSDKSKELLSLSERDISFFQGTSNSTFTKAPLFQQAFRWFHKEHGLYSSIVPKKSYPDDYVSGVEWYINICGGDGKEIGPDGVYSYEEAELACC